jgi:hypothetical protein
MHDLFLFCLLTLSPRPLAPGVEYLIVNFGSAQAHVVRLEPERAPLAFALSSKSGRGAQTAAQWASQKGMVVAINAGMFKTDGRSNVGYLVDGDHINHGTYNKYLSALVFGPKKKGLPKAQLLDLDQPGAKDLAANYRSVVQNLRLIKAPGVSVWSRNGRAWSEAAVAQDKQGRLLFIFTREGLEMAEWNRLLLGSDLEVVRAMHVEGGPEASLSIHGKDLTLDLCGSFETGFNSNENNLGQWPIPNVLGVAFKDAPKAANPK